MRDWAHIDFRLRASLQDRFFSPFISIIAVKKELDKFYTPNIEWIEHEEHRQRNSTGTYGHAMGMWSKANRRKW